MRLFALVFIFVTNLAWATSVCEDLPAPALLPGSTVSAPKDADLCSYFDAPAVLVVNTASQCGYTGQFKDLEQLYQRYKSQGLAVIGFPSADFGGQEHNDAHKTAEVCYRNYGVTFPVFEKSHVVGPAASPLFQRLGAAAHPPRWNFHKYLVTPAGVQDFPSAVKPLGRELTSAIERAVMENATAAKR